jgi:hypothetical protein
VSRPSSPRFRSQVVSTSQRFPSRPKLRSLVKPHPFGSFPSEFSPRSSRAHLSEPLAPLWLSTRVQSRTARRLVTVCFQGPPPCGRVAISPDGYGLPFGLPRYASRSPWALSSRVASYRWLHPLRSLVPPTSPFSPAPDFSRTGGRYSPGFLPLWSFLLPRLGLSAPPDSTSEAWHTPRLSRFPPVDPPRRVHKLPTRSRWSATQETSRPLEPGETVTARVRDCLVDRHQSLKVWAASPLGEVPTPLALERRANPTLRPSKP